MIVEDDLYGDLCFVGEVVLLMFVLVGEVDGVCDWFVYFVSLLKIVVLGLCVGWMIVLVEIMWCCVIVK